MRWPKHKQQGFTLIEIMMVLAISSLLMLILLGSYNQNRRRAQFTDAIERIVTALEQAKNEANTTVNTNQSNPGANQSQIVFAKVVDFSTASACGAAGTEGKFRVRTLLAAREDELADIAEDCTAVHSSDIAWGITFRQPLASGSTSTANLVAFTRNPANGRLNTYVMSAGNNNLTSPAAYNAGQAADEDTAILEFQSPEGLRATVAVNALNNEITRRFLN